MRKVKPSFKVWLETEGGYIFGEGPFELLKRVQEFGTLSQAADSMGMSYRHAWGIIKRVERALGEPILRTRKGGRAGGGGAQLTEAGIRLLEEFSEIKSRLSEICLHEPYTTMGTNSLEGTVESIEAAGDKATLKIRVDTPQTVKSTTTAEVVERLNIREGGRVTVRVRVTSVAPRD